MAAPLTRALHQHFLRDLWGNVTLYAKWVVSAGFKDVAPTDWVYAQGWLSYATKYIPMMGYFNGNFGSEDDIACG